MIIERQVLPLEKYVGIILSLPFMIAFSAAIIHLVIKITRDHHAQIKTVPAVVIDKHKIEIVSKYSGTGKQTKYVVVFSVNGKKKSFYVSSFSYNGYRVKEKGRLTYQGDRLIDFK